MRSRTRRTASGGGILGISTVNSVPTTHFAPYSTTVATCSDELHRGPPYRSGGPLAIFKERTAYRITKSISVTYGGLPSSSYNGAFYASVPPSNWNDTERSISGWGAIGWNRSIPTAPSASLGVFIGELKDAPRMLLQTKKLFQRLASSKIKLSNGKKVRDLKDIGWTPKDGGSDYLNLQFGWVPFLRDLYSMFGLQETLAKRITQLKRDNGRTVHRRRTLRREDWQELKSLQTSTISAFLFPALPTQLNSTTINVDRVTKKFSLRTWFEAEFVYYSPELADPGNSLLKLKLDLLGLSLDADVIYNLVPWSWLLDWFTNTGTLVSNAVLLSKYHVVAKYAYVMQSQRTVLLREATGRYKLGSSPWPTPPPAVMLTGITSTTRDFKRREAANPYGFGITDSALSAYQWSILVALGLTRFR